VSLLDGKRVLVVGASSGIGAAAAERFAEQGADLALVARGDGLALASERARGHGVAAHELRADVTDRVALAGVVEQARALLGGIDVAVLAVGAATWGPFDEVDADEFDRVIDVTFRSTVDQTRLLLPILEDSGGVLVIVGSVAGRIPLPLMSSYVAAKHAVHGFAGSLRMELRARRSRVRVAVVAPGPVDTPFWQHAANPAGFSALPPALAPYSPQTVAEAIVDVAARPRREYTVGGMMLAAKAAYSLAATLSERVMALGIRQVWGDEDSPADPATLERPSGDGATSGGLHGRPSLVVNLRHATGDLARAALSRAR
jgi:short-subunit dehydrogenase